MNESLSRPKEYPRLYADDRLPIVLDYLLKKIAYLETTPSESADQEKQQLLKAHEYIVQEKRFSPQIDTIVARYLAKDICVTKQELSQTQTALKAYEQRLKQLQANNVTTPEYMKDLLKQIRAGKTGYQWQQDYQDLSLGIDTLRSKLHQAFAPYQAVIDALNIQDLVAQTVKAQERMSVHASTLPSQPKSTTLLQYGPGVPDLARKYGKIVRPDVATAPLKLNTQHPISVSKKNK